VAGWRGSSTPKIAEVGEGEARYDGRKEAVEWRIEMVDGSNKTGSMEFTAPDTDPASFFPINVRGPSPPPLVPLPLFPRLATLLSRPVTPPPPPFRPVAW
jgi:hypothetical protein